MRVEKKCVNEYVCMHGIDKRFNSHANQLKLLMLMFILLLLYSSIILISNEIKQVESG